ncbi:MAG: hypothetical protein EA362_03315 [Saprospirales bacterium]|nr:MAG: hypothetical protein EA362_03315 [Saprospirales bacterium]
MIKSIFPLLTLLFSPFLTEADSTMNQDSIYIGASMSLSGAYATQGLAANNGYLLCEEHLNKRGGLLGKPIKFLIYDDQSNVDRARDIYQKLLSKKVINAVMGPYGSTLTEAVADITESHQMTMISPLAATSSIWEQGREYLIMVLPPAELFLAGLIDLADQQGFSKIAILQEEQLFPQAAGNGAAKLIEERGLDLVFHQSYSSGKSDFTEIIEALKDQEVEVLGMAASSLSDFILFVHQMNEKGLQLNLFGTSGAVDQFQKELGSLAELTLGLSAWEPELNNPGIEGFTKDYKNRFEISPSFHAAGAYGSCMLLAEAIQRAESLDQNKIRQELLNLETTTIFSNYAVDKRGYQTANKGLFIQWQNGKRVIVWPEEEANGVLLLWHE